MTDITEKQGSVLAFCVGHILEYDNFPTTRTIQRHFGWKSQSAAINHLVLLEKKGIIKRHDGKRMLVDRDALSACREFEEGAE